MYGFIVASDTQFEIADGVARELKRRDPSATCVLVSARTFLGIAEYDEKRLSRFDERHIPKRIRASSLRRACAFLASKTGLVGLAKRMSKRPVLDCYDRCLRNANPDVVFMLNDRGYPELDLIKAFQAKGVPVVLLQESIRRDDSFDDLPGLLWNGQGGCDRIYAWGETSLEYYRSAGVPDERIVVVGCPRIDQYVESGMGRRDKSGLRERLRLPLDRPLILIATNPVYRMKLVKKLPWEEYVACIESVIAWAADQGAFVLVKPHLLEKADHARLGLVAHVSSHENAAYAADLPLVDAIAASDAVLIFNSTVALEAALLGKPSGLLATDRYTHGTDYERYGLSVPVNSADSLRAMLANLNHDGLTASARKYVSQDFKSASRIVDDVQAWLSGRKRP